MSRILPAAALLVVMTVVAPYVASAQAPAPIARKVVITVVDGEGQPVPGLTAADLELKEGGRTREISAVEPATAKMRIALLLEESLTPLGAVRQGMGEFLQKMTPVAEVALVVVGLSNRTVVPYTSDMNQLIAGINALPLSQRQQVNHVPEGIHEQARTFEEEQPERPVIVMIALDSQQESSEQPQNVLNQLRDSGAQLHVVSIQAPQSPGSAAMMMEMSGRAQVLGDGPKQSGGRQHAVNAITAVPKAMLQIAADLSSQYVVSYSLPGGQRPSERLSVEIERRGLTLRAPSRIAAR